MKPNKTLGICPNSFLDDDRHHQVLFTYFLFPLHQKSKDISNFDQFSNIFSI